MLHFARCKSNSLLIAEYEKKLKAAGVYCELLLVKGAIHGFCTMPG